MKNIFLVGMPGSGKSTLGKKVAEALNREHIDTDEMITKSTGTSPEEIILLHGELELRKLEHQLLLTLLKQSDLVISTGGGFPVYNENMMIMNERAITLYIKYSEEILWNRLKNDRVRPLSSTYESIVELLNKRENVYEKAKIILSGEDDLGKNRENCIDALMKQFPSEIMNSC